MNQGAILNQYYSKDLVDSLTKLIGKETGTIVMHSSLLGLGFPREGLDYFANDENKLVYKLGYNLLFRYSLLIVKKNGLLYLLQHIAGNINMSLKEYTSYKQYTNSFGSGYMFK